MSTGLMRVCTWNVNGIRTLPTPLKSLLDRFDADVICFQETKCSRDLDSQLACVDGYNAYFSHSTGKPGYSGVAIYCRDPVRPVSATEGFVQTFACAAPHMTDPAEFLCSGVGISRSELKQLDSEGRVVSVVLSRDCLKVFSGSGDLPVKSVYILSVYMPRIVESEVKRVEFRLLFERTFTWVSHFLSQTHHVVICGDLNVCHTDRDHCELEQLDTHSSVVLTARQWINNLLVVEQRDPTIPVNPTTASGRFVDVFRHVHPTRPFAYTCWSTRTGARATNYGVRIDYILVDRDLLAYFDCNPTVEIQSDLLVDQFGSDHCPVWAELPLSLSSMTTWNHSWPALCSRYWPQCQHKQTSLTTFVARDVHEPVAYGDSASSRTPVVANKESVIRVLRGGDTIDSSGGTNDTRGKRSTSNAPSATSDKSNEKLKLKQAKLLIVSSVASHTKNGDESKPKSTPSFENMEPVTSPTPRPSTTTKLTSSNSATHMIETKQTVQSAHEWRRLLTGPKKPPLCRGHSEPCVLRTVKQEYTASGARRGKRFWVCGRPQGFRGNPEARCETFIWDDRYQNITR